MNVEFNFSNVFDFYKETDILEDTRREGAWEKHCQNEESSFRGLPLKEILDSQYSYKKGLEDLKKLDFEIEGGSKKVYKWSDQDGDEMSTERLNEQLPFMQQRVNTLGNKRGKFITLNVAICETAWVGYESMLHRAYCAVSLADYLEELGYKVAVNCYFDSVGSGDYKGEHVDVSKLTICIKQPEEPLNKGLMLTCISPWFFRYWVFKFLHAKYYTTSGLGRPANTELDDTRELIWLPTGSCLNPEKVNAKIKAIKELFSKEEE